MPFFCSFIPWYSVIITITFGCAIVAFFPLAANIERLTFHTAGAAFCTSFLVSAFFSVIPILRMSKYGLYHIILVVLTSVVTEVSAYFVGRTFGKHRLIPKVSPGKTVEGFVGGIAISYLVILALGIITSHLTNTPIRYDIFSLYLILASVIGQIGDLTMSLIKRAAKIKDFGRLLPGHGGVLDRFDSQFFIAPFTLAFYTLVGQIF